MNKEKNGFMNKNMNHDYLLAGHPCFLPLFPEDTEGTHFFVFDPGGITAILEL